MEPEKERILTDEDTLMEQDRIKLQIISALLFSIITLFSVVAIYYSLLTASWLLFFIFYFGGIVLLYFFTLFLPVFVGREQLKNQVIRVLSLLLGIGFTFVIFVMVYGDEALVFLFKGISLQNLSNLIFQEMNLTELFSWFYFIILFFILFFVNRVITKGSLVKDLSENQKTQISSTVRSFREGSVILPAVIMIGFPSLLQVILPTLIISVAFFELLFPFVVVGEIFHLSLQGLISLLNNFNLGINKNSMIQNNKNSKNNNQEKNGLRHILGIISSLIIIVIFPLFVFYIIDAGFIRFLNLVHYNLLWHNPDSFIAVPLWNMINDLITILSLNITFLSDFFHYSKYFVVPLIILTLISILYLAIKRNARKLIAYPIDRFILPYK